MTILTNAYRAVIAAQEKLQEEMGPLATAVLLSEMTSTLERDPYRGRVFAVAERKVRRSAAGQERRHRLSSGEPQDTKINVW
jgi:hypothetical protein